MSQDKTRMDASPVAAPWSDEEDELEEEEGDDPITKKLVFETPLKRQASKKQSVVVFLRVRPKNQREIMSMDASCLHLVNQRELQAVAPESSQTFKNKAGVRCPEGSSQQFTFTHIFHEQATQRDVFEESMLSTLKDFFGGQNCLVFTYGVTNSGKTYTVTGTVAEPGILPRSLDLIFNSISPQQLSSLQLKPKNFSEAVYLTESEVDNEETRKEAVLSKAREIPLSEVNGGMEETVVDVTTDGSDISCLSKTSSNYSKVSESGTSLCEIQVQDGSTIELEDSAGVCYSLWVSFAEIYNELIYDLLAEEPCKTRRSRPALKLAEDRNHNHFIKGLSEVKVSSREEAMLLLQLGLRHRHVASTRLNYQSSRSHTIFTIKMMKTASGSERPHNAFINRISIVDLAGAERSKETGARGMRVREAGSINNSLLTLGKCIEAMRQNQNKRSARRGDEHVVPFRESKLTRLFQNYFVGKGKGMRQGRITMLVNVSNSAAVFDETVHVLRFSAITSKVIPVVRSIPARRPTTQPHPPSSSYRPIAPPPSFQRPTACPRLPLMTPQPLRGCRIVDNDDNDKTIEARRTVPVCEQCEVTREECAKLHKRLRSLELEKMESEHCIRQEVCREFQDQLIAIEETHRAELEEQAEDMQTMYEKRMQLLQKSMKKQFSRKRRRVETLEEGDGEEEEGVGSGRSKEETLLRETVAELEEQLDAERQRVVAELRDTMETHETRVTHLNQQMNCVCLRLTEAEQRETQLKDDLARVTAAAEAVEVGSRERERELISDGEGLQRRLGTANAEILELTREKEHLSCAQLSLISEYEGRESQLREEIASLRSELQDTRETVADLTVRLEGTQREMETVSWEERERVQTAETARDDAMAEVEILQARISELTQEAKEAQMKLATLSTDSSSESEVVCLQEQIQELHGQLEEKEGVMKSLQATSAAERHKIQEQLHSLLTAVVTVRDSMNTGRQELADEILRHSQQIQGVLSAERERQEVVNRKVAMLHCVQSQLAAQQEEVQTLETQLRENETAVDELNRTLREGESVRQSQLARISEMSRELQHAQSSKEALGQHVTVLETRLTNTEAENSRLTALVDTLKAQVEEGSQKLAQREHELQASSEHSRDQREALETQLREKDAELQTLANSSSQDKTSLMTEVQSLMEMVERLQQEKIEREHTIQPQAALPDSHQVGTSIRPDGEVTEEREETLQQAHDSEITQSFDQPITTQESKNRSLSTSDAKPYTAVLDSSSQLVEETFTEEPRIQVDATPPIARRRRQRCKNSVQIKGEESTPVKKGKYSLRDRRKHQRFTGEEENRRPKNIFTRSARKLAALATGSPSLTSLPPQNPEVRITKCMKRAIRTSQISGPLGLVGENAGAGLGIPHQNSLAIGPGAPPLYFDHQN